MNYVVDNYAYEKILCASRYWEQAKEDLEKATYLEQVIFSDYVRAIKSSRTSWDNYSTYFKEAVAELKDLNIKEHSTLTFIEKDLKNIFFRNIERDYEQFEFKINNIISGGYESYYWDIYFNFCDEEFVLSIPSRDKLTEKNIKYAHHGKFVLYKKTSMYSTDWLFDDWSEEKFAKKLEEYFGRYLFF